MKELKKISGKKYRDISCFLSDLNTELAKLNSAHDYVQASGSSLEGNKHGEFPFRFNLFSNFFLRFV